MGEHELSSAMGALEHKAKKKVWGIKKKKKEVDRQAFVDEKGPSLFNRSTLSNRRRVVNDRRSSYRRMGFIFFKMTKENV